MFHFCQYFEQKVKNTIDKYDLLPSEKVAVAASGGKDSTVLLYILKKFNYDVVALAVDEKIPGYRDKTLDFLRGFCSRQGIKLDISDFGLQSSANVKTLAMSTNKSPCNVCGIMRRRALAEMSSGYEIIATGHNMDDELQTMLLNVMLGNPELTARLGPKSGSMKMEGVAQRVKPFYFMQEREILAYAVLKKINPQFIQCPHSFDSFRANIRKMLDELEELNHGFKQGLFENLVLFTGKSDGKPSICSECGRPAAKSPCNYCRTMKIVLKVLNFS